MQEQTFSELLLGGLSSAEWKFQLLLITLGIFLRVFRRVYKRDDKNTGLSVRYWFKDVRNWAKLVYSLILMYVLIRFYSEYENSIKSFIPENFQASIYLIMFGLGFSLHRIADFLDSKLLTKNGDK